MSLTVNRVVFFKFIETALRSLSILLATYALDTYSAGLFALILTFQGFASFVFGFERHIDIQRRNVAETDVLF